VEVPLAFAWAWALVVALVVALGEPLAGLESSRNQYRKEHSLGHSFLHMDSLLLRETIFYKQEKHPYIRSAIIG
jgi:hypothetical protein